MATNLRLRPDAQEAVRAESKRTGKSQQEIIRDAVDRHLKLNERAEEPAARLPEEVLPPRLPLLRPATRLVLQDGATSIDLLNRDDRI